MALLFLDQKREHQRLGGLLLNDLIKRKDQGGKRQKPKGGGHCPTGRSALNNLKHRNRLVRPNSEAWQWGRKAATKPKKASSGQILPWRKSSTVGGEPADFSPY